MGSVLFTLTGVEIKMEIIYEDRAVIVCYKPAGIATQTKRLGQQDMESLLKNDRVAKRETPYIGVIHRLDQPVEGIMVFAKTPQAAAKLSAQVQKRSIGKFYYAIAPAFPDGKEEGILTDYLLADKRNNSTRVVAQNTPQSQRAELAYRIVAAAGDGAGAPAGYVKYDIRLHTGRHHQIRVQLSEAGMPILNDTKYGVTPNEENIKDTLRAGRDETLALCSYRLVFSHPVTRKKLTFEVIPKGKSFELFSEDFCKKDDI